MDFKVHMTEHGLFWKALSPVISVMLLEVKATWVSTLMNKSSPEQSKMCNAFR